jgi:hypothetical protein
MARVVHRRERRRDGFLIWWARHDDEGHYVYAVALS